MVLFVHKVSTNFVNDWLSVIYKCYQNVLKNRIFEGELSPWWKYRNYKCQKWQYSITKLGSTFRRFSLFFFARFWLDIYLFIVIYSLFERMIPSVSVIPFTRYISKSRAHTALCRSCNIMGYKLPSIELICLFLIFLLSLQHQIS